MWEPKGKIIDKKALGSLAPEEVLFEYEEPLTFVAEDPEGHLLLAHCVGCDRGASRYLVAASSRTVIEDLKAGRSDVLGALRQPRCWIADIGPSGAVESLWAVDFESVPKDVLPRPGSMLTPALQSLFRVRLIGEGVGPGRTSAADVRMAAQAAETSLKTLAEITLKQRKQSGRPTRQIRYYSDLPVQYLGAASFEIGLRPPDASTLIDLDKEVFAEMGAHLDSAFKALRDGNVGSSIPGLDQDQSTRLIEALKALTPSTQGDVDRVEIGGALVERYRPPVTLTREDRRAISARLKIMKGGVTSEEPFRVRGVISEADQELRSFRLRDLVHVEDPRFAGVDEMTFGFDEHVYEIVMEAFISLERVVVVGEMIAGKHQALDIKFESAPPT